MSLYIAEGMTISIGSKNDSKTFTRINELIRDVLQSQFEGIGKTFQENHSVVLRGTCEILDESICPQRKYLSKILQRSV